MLLNRTPLAWRNLVHNGRRLLVALLGIGFAVVLIFAETGFQSALLDSTVKVLDELDADLILASRACNTLISAERFDRHRIHQAEACDGVREVSPLYVQMDALWKAEGQKASPIRVLAFDPRDPVFRTAEVVRQAAALEAPGSALFDRKSKPKYGMAFTPGESSFADAELCGRSIRIVGTFAMGTDFLNDGNVLVSDRSLARHCPGRLGGQEPLSMVDLGLVQLSPGADEHEVQRRLQSLLPGDVRVYRKQEFIDQEIAFWNQGTGIGFIFWLGMLIGFLVGVIVCYQIISADIGDHLAEFATLKAIGYRNRYFVGFVLEESVYLSVLAFFPALLISFGLYRLLAHSTGLLMVLTFWRAARVFAFSLGMCIISGVLAMRKVTAADPADLY